MTTIVFKNGVLAADSQRNHHLGEGLACPHCQRDSHFVVPKEAAAKLRLFTGTLTQFQGQQLRLMGASGASTWTALMYEMLKGNRDIIAFNEDWAKVSDRSKDRETGSGSLILVTTEKVHLLRLSNPRPKERHQQFDLGTKEVLTIGSGGEYAYAAATCFGKDAVNSVLAAAQCDPHTDMRVQYVELWEQGSASLEVKQHVLQNKKKKYYRP